MSPLASRIYKHLATHVRRNHNSINSALSSRVLRAPAKPGLAINSAFTSRVLRAPAKPGLAITYGELAKAVGVHQRSPALHSALGEVTNACRHADLPALPAIVWRADSKRPSDGYYKAAHPRAHTDAARIAAWEREHARVISAAASFPTKLE